MATRKTPAEAAAPMRVLVVDDGRLYRECLVAQLQASGFQASGAWNLPSLFSEVDAGMPGVIVLNIDTADSRTLLQVSLDIGRGTKVVVIGLSVDRESDIVAAAEAGVAGLHLRSESLKDLLTLISHAGAGKAQCSSEVSAILMRRVYSFVSQVNPDSSTDSLTGRESEILGLLDQGLTNQQIASRLSVTLHTVKNHVHSLLTKLGVGSRAEAVQVFRANKYANRG